MKKLFAAFLALVMVVSSLCLPAVAAQTTPTNADVELTQSDFVADTNDYDADQDTTEMLARAKVEAALASKTDAVIVLKEDITVSVSSTTVFPLLADTFYGYFYGAEHSITFSGDIAINSTANVGVLFGTVGINDSANSKVADAEIYDLTVKGVKATFSGTSSQIGTIAGVTGRVLKMNNVHVEAALTKSTTGNSNVGGFLGKANNTTTFVDCSFNGTIGYTGTAACSVGGIVGAAVQNLNIQACSVNANNKINGKIEGVTRVGGLVALIDLPDMTKTATIAQKCEVYGTVSTTGVAGGLVGSVEGNGSLNMSRNGTIYAPTNYAAVTATGGNAGGIIGRIYGTDTETGNTPRVTMNMISNQGDVTGSGSVAGGMIGLVQNVVLVTDGDYNIRIYNNSSNTGNVTGKNFVGGVIGRVYTSAVVKIENTTNTGNVQATAAFAGGFIGMSDGAATITIADSLNMGNVTGKRDVGGIFAHQRTAAAKSISITGCVNMGSVTTPTDAAGQAAGGIVGRTAIASTAIEISNCLNFGTVTNTRAEGPVAGGIYGSLTEVVAAQTVVDNTDLTASGTTTAVANGALLTSLDGARIRLSSDVAQAGIRFDIGTNAKMLDALVAAGYEVKLGSMMAKAETVASTAFTKEALTAGTYSAVEQAYGDANVKADNTYSAAVNNIPAAAYDVDFACVGYMTLTKDGTTYTIYTAYNAEKNAGNVEEIAYKALADDAANDKIDYSGYQVALETLSAGYVAE